MKPPQAASEDPIKTYHLQLPDQGKKDALAGLLLALAVTITLCIGFYYLVRWLPWLFWPLIVLNGLWISGCWFASAAALRRHIAGSDTATSTIRSAAQGATELKGRVKAIPGHELNSPVHQMPCVRYQTEISRSASSVLEPFLFREHGSRALLIDDGTGEVFAPRFANTFSGLLLQSIKTIRHLPDRLQDQIRSSPEDQGVDIPRGPYDVRESVMPVGVRVQVNAIFVTLKASDSYIGAWERLGNDLEVLLSARQRKQIESDWRAYADTFLEKTDDSSNQAPLLNALMPFKGDTSFTLQYLKQKRNTLALEEALTLLVMSIASVILVLILFGWLSPQDLWPWV